MTAAGEKTHGAVSKKIWIHLFGIV